MKNKLEIKKRTDLLAELDNGKYKEYSNCTFSTALELAKRGYRIARAGWNGQGMYAYIVPAASYPAQTPHAKEEFGDMVPYRAYWALKTAQNDVACWTPSGTDTLSEDWIVYEN